jgi:prepilin-type N-terminal cleavage/methylation domain-containing protein
VKKNLLSRHPRGFTLLEIMVALTITGILIVTIMRFYLITVNNYSLQDEIADMNQNAKYVMKEISDLLTQAGVDCSVIDNPTPDMDTIIKLTGAGPVYKEFTIKVNPRGGLYVITSAVKLNTTTKCSLLVDDATKFRYADKCARIPRSGATDSTIKVYNLVGVDTVSNKICLSGGKSTSETFDVGDAVYSFVNNRYYLNGTNLCLNDTANILAENINLFQITFYNISGDSVLTSSLPWKSMRSANLLVEATTSKRYSGNQKRRIKLSHQFRLRNRIGRDL